MEINKYAPFFHDGTIYDIKQSVVGIVIYMQSAEVHEDELMDKIPLSPEYRIKGKLHLEKLKSIKNNEKPMLDKIKMLYDSAGILDFEIISNTAKLFVEWRNYPPNPRIVAYSFFEIEAEKIWWENIPNLKVP